MKLREVDLISLLYSVNGLCNNHDLAMRVISHLENKTLEIEGYERVQWTRFDPKAPKTFPKRREDVLFADRDSVAFGYIDTCGTIYSWVKSPTHWRPLPKPPVETEVQK